LCNSRRNKQFLLREWFLALRSAFRLEYRPLSTVYSVPSIPDLRNGSAMVTGNTDNKDRISLRLRQYKIYSTQIPTGKNALRFFCYLLNTVHVSVFCNHNRPQRFKPMVVAARYKA